MSENDDSPEHHASTGKEDQSLDEKNTKTPEESSKIDINLNSNDDDNNSEKCTELQAIIDKLESENDDLQSELDNQRSKAENLATENFSLLTQLSDEGSKIRTLENKVSNLENKCQEYEDENSRLNEELAEKEEDYRDLLAARAAEKKAESILNNNSNQINSNSVQNSANSQNDNTLEKTESKDSDPRSLASNLVSHHGSNETDLERLSKKLEQKALTLAKRERELEAREKSVGIVQQNLNNGKTNSKTAKTSPVASQSDDKISTKATASPSSGNIDTINNVITQNADPEIQSLQFFTCVHDRGVAYRSEPDLSKRCAQGPRYEEVVGACWVDESLGEGWIKTPEGYFLPIKVNGQQVLRPFTEDAGSANNASSGENVTAAGVFNSLFQTLKDSVSVLDQFSPDNKESSNSADDENPDVSQSNLEKTTSSGNAIETIKDSADAEKIEPGSETNLNEKSKSENIVTTDKAAADGSSDEDQVPRASDALAG